MDNNIIDFLKDIPDKYDANKTISLYNLIKQNCPLTVKNLNIKIYGQHLYLFKSNNEPKWYTQILNYLVQTGILSTEKNKDSVYHNVNEKYVKYFLIPKSTCFSLSNCDKHLLLYKEASQEFLIKAGLLDKKGQEFFTETKTESKNILSEKNKKYLNYLFVFLLFWSIIQFIILISKFGINNMIPIFLNCILFTVSIILITK